MQTRIRATLERVQPQADFVVLRLPDGSAEELLVGGGSALAYLSDEGREGVATVDGIDLTGWDRVPRSAVAA